MTVGVTWMRRLAKRDHAISEGAKIGGGHLKAECRGQIYPLGLSAEGTRRYCRRCIKVIRAAVPESRSLPQRMPGQVLRKLSRRFHRMIQ